MLTTCHACNTLMRVPDDAAGKSVQCPQCSAVNFVNAAAPPTDPGNLPPPPRAKVNESESIPTLDVEAISEKPGVSPRSAIGEAGSANENSRPSPRRLHDDDDDPNLDVRKRVRQRSSDSAEAVHGMAMTSMIMGIISILVGLPGLFPGCCCGFFSIIALLGGGVCLLLGILGRSPGSEGIAWAGIICSSVGMAIGVIGLALFFFVLFAGGGLRDFQRGFNRGRAVNNVNQPPPDFRR